MSSIVLEERPRVAAELVVPERLVWQLYDQIFNEGELSLADDIIAAEAITRLQHADPDLPARGPEHVREFVPLFCAVFQMPTG